MYFCEVLRYNYKIEIAVRMLNSEKKRQMVVYEGFRCQHLAPWQSIDNFYPFYNTLLFSFEGSKKEAERNTSPSNFKIEPTEHFPPTERPLLQLENSNLAIVKEQQEEEEERPYSKTRIVVRDRNILSNNTNLILSLVRRPSKSQGTVSRILDELNSELGVEYNHRGFYSYQNYIKENVNDYRNKNAIKAIVAHCDPACPIFTIPQQLFYNQVCRILIRNYIANKLLIDVLSLKKIKKTNRADHLKVHRYLAKILEGTKSADICHLYKL